MFNLFRGALLAVLLVAVASMATYGTVMADGGAANAVENCNEDNALGHGGSVDNPPDCDEDTPESVEVPADTETPAPANVAASVSADSECGPRTYTRMRTVTDMIGGKVVGTYQYPETHTLEECPTSQTGSTSVEYSDWTLKR